MIGLTYEQKCSIGFQYILDRLNPSSPYGQEKVRRLVPYLPSERDRVEQEWDNIGRLIENRREVGTEISQLRRIFMQMKDIRPALRKAGEMCLNDIELFELKNFCIYTEQAQMILKRLCGLIGLTGLDYRSVKGPLELLDPDGRRIPTFSIYDSYSEKLASIRRQKREAEKQMDAASSEEAYNRYKEERHQIILLEEEEEQRIREVLTDSLVAYLDDLAYDADVTGRMDLLIEKSYAAGLAPSIRPQLTQEELVLSETVNPWVASVLKERNLSFTPISIELGLGAGVITGANMGGKSVALKTITLNVLLALSGFYVYALEAKVPFFEKIMILSEEMQSVDKGLSSFGAEIIQMKQIIEAVKKEYCFVGLDEFSRGTNPHEGAALVRSVVKFLNTRKVVGLLVTHFAHVAEYGRNHYQVVGLKDMDENRVEKEISMAGREKGVGVIASHMNYGLYKVGNMAGCPRDAFRICHLLGLQEEVMQYIEEE